MSTTAVKEELSRAVVTEELSTTAVAEVLTTMAVTENSDDGEVDVVVRGRKKRFVSIFLFFFVDMFYFFFFSGNFVVNQISNGLLVLLLIPHFSLVI